jgi:hypothetical protein
MNENDAITVVDDERSRLLIEQAVALQRSRGVAGSHQTGPAHPEPPAAAGRGFPIDQSLTRRRAIGAAAALAGAGLLGVVSATPARAEPVASGTTFHGPPFGGSWVTGSPLSHSENANSGLLHLGVGSGDAARGPYGNRDCEMGWSFVLTTERRVWIEIRPWIQWEYFYTVGHIGLAPSARIELGLRVSAQGFTGWGSPGGLGGGGTFHKQNYRELKAEVTDDNFHESRDENTTNDMRLNFVTDPGQPAVIRVGSRMRTYAEKGPLGAGDAGAGGWLNATLRFAWIETRPA